MPDRRGGSLRLLAGLGEPVQAVGAQALQHHVAGPAIRTGPRRHQQRAVDQMQHSQLGGGPGDRRCTLQGERAREDCQPPEHLLLMLIEQLVAPVHGRRQRPLPRRRGPVGPGQQREPVIEPLQQLCHAECLHPRRRQLDRQRHSIQPPHQPLHQRARLTIQSEMRVELAGPVGKQSHRLRLCAIARGAWPRQPERPPQAAGLPGQPGVPGPSGLRILIGSSLERTGSRGREIPEIHS